MMEFGHFISVIVELACRAPNDGNICYCAPGAPIPLSISLKAALIVWQIALWTPVLEAGKSRRRRRRRRRQIGGENILYMFLYLQDELMEKRYSDINSPSVLSQAIAASRSRLGCAVTARDEMTTLSGSRPTPKKSLLQTNGCLLVSFT